MKTKLLQITFGLLLTNAAFLAQVSNYTFTQTASSYGSPSTGTLVGQPLQDDDVNAITLPFTFTFNGTPYTTLNVCSNGYVSFNALSGFEYAPISDLSTQDLIAPFGTDLFMGTGITADMTTGSNTLTNCSSVAGFSIGDVFVDYALDFAGTNPTITAISGNNIVLNTNAVNTNSAYDMIGLNGYIKRNVSGTSPNRIFELEFRNFNGFAYDEVISFKLRLFETTNQIEFLYGTIIPGVGSFPPEVGLKGSTSTDFNSRTVSSSNTWATSAAATNITDVCDFNSTLFPASGQSYKWSPPSCITPTLISAQSKSTTCAGETSTIIVVGATTYTWSNGATTAFIAVSPSTTTSYTVIGANSTCTSSLVLTQTVVPNPVLSISQSGSVICAGESATLTASGASTYAWVNGPNTAQNIVSPSVSSSYTVTGYAAPASYGTCSSTLTSDITVSVCTGINETNILSSTLSAYPNPFSTELQVNNSANADIQVSIIDAVGKLVSSTSVKGNSNQVIDTSNLSKGLYFIKFSLGSESITKKIIKD